GAWRCDVNPYGAAQLLADDSPQDATLSVFSLSKGVRTHSSGSDRRYSFFVDGYGFGGVPATGPDERFGHHDRRDSTWAGRYTADGGLPAVRPAHLRRPGCRPARQPCDGRGLP